MKSMNYQLTYDNELLSKDDKKRWVFKLVFEGPKIVEVSNDDWRDYTEHFNFYIDSKKIFTTNIDNYGDVRDAYDKCQSSLELNIK